MFITKSTVNTTGSKNQVTTRVINDFDDPCFTEEQWMLLLEEGETNTINLTWRWQRSWWNAFGKGELLLVLAEQDGKAVALAPLFTIEGMIYNICPEDCLDFIGDVKEPSILDAMLKEAIKKVPEFLGFLFYFIPETSTTGKLLKQSAHRVGLTLVVEGQIASPWIDLKGQPETAVKITRKKSLRRHENYFFQNGEVHVLHLNRAPDILPHLESFFEQHIKRRAAIPATSIFLSHQQREYYFKLTEEMDNTGWLRFTVIYWKGKSIAYHFGLAYNGRYLYAIPSFDIEYAKHSPGELLLRQLLLAAINEGADSFDFGIGDEPYKMRFSTNVTQLFHYGLYPLPQNHE